MGRSYALTANHGHISGSYGGLPLDVGVGLGLEVLAIASGGVVRAFIAYSQG